MVDLVNDAELRNEEILWRRISPDQLRIEADGEPRCSDGAFRTAEMSVHIASRTSLEQILQNYPHHSVVAFSAGFVRSIECIVASDPDDPAHALVCRKDDPTKRLTGSQVNKIAQEAQFVVVRRP